ncbi:MAG TPA: hypothetical protein PKC85_00240 [Bacteroidia bacterium]|jgi:hypothetical protein|nr:hypothetical protein [Bacteroidia bacterium]HMU18247.1 hypothetical protein [Bacteroidia bacterium]
MVRIAFTFIILLYTTGNTFAQLQMFADSVIKGSSDSIRQQYQLQLTDVMQKFLAAEQSFNTSFDTIPSISTITSADNLIRFYQWIQPNMETQTYSIHGMMQVKDKKSKTIKIFTLTDGAMDKYTASDKILNTDNYFAAIYYSIIPLKENKKTIYTLLGWRGVDNRTTVKTIDVLHFQKNKPVFGKKIFKAPANMLPVTSAEKCTRVVFQYNAQAVMSLKYYSKGKKIVFDHLSPPKATLKGAEETYGPDFTYDAFIWKKGKWQGKSDIDMRNSHNTDGQKITPVKDSDLRK